jgi:hypothetical protein
LRFEARSSEFQKNSELADSEHIGGIIRSKGSLKKRQRWGRQCMKKRSVEIWRCRWCTNVGSTPLSFTWIYKLYASKRRMDQGQKAVSCSRNGNTESVKSF